MTSQRRVCLTLAIAFAIATGPAGAQVAIVDRPDTTAKYDHYVANRRAAGAQSGGAAAYRRGSPRRAGSSISWNCRRTAFTGT